MARSNSLVRAGLTRKYFLIISSLLLLFSVWGFSDNLFWDIGQPSNKDPKFVVHGLFCLAWMIFLVVQSALIANRSVALHRKIGLAGFAVALAMMASTLYLFVAIWKGWANMAPFVKANRILFASFAICVMWAILARRKPAWHKRLMLVGTFFIMEPMLSRVFGTAEITLLKDMSDSQLDAAWYMVVYPLWASLFASLFVHDWLTTKQFHPVTVSASSWIVLVLIGVHWM